MTYAEKALLIHHARKRAKSDAVDGGRLGLCLYIAHHVAGMLFDRGLNPLVQAGTASWQYDIDTGQNDNFFTFEWQGMDHPHSRIMLAQRMLPEMHVWVALRSTGEIIDGSTADWPRLAKKMMHFEWSPRVPRPPAFLWQTPPLPETCMYLPTVEACLMACKALCDLYGGVPSYLEHLQEA